MNESHQLCCMKGEKVSTPLDKDGRGPSGLYNTHTVKALPPTSWHLTMFFPNFFAFVFFQWDPKVQHRLFQSLSSPFPSAQKSPLHPRPTGVTHPSHSQPVPKMKLHLPGSSQCTILVSRALSQLIPALQPPHTPHFQSCAWAHPCPPTTFPGLCFS